MENGKRFRFSYAPYERGMLEAWDDPAAQIIVYMLASRLGKTEVIMNGLGHAVDEQPRRILVMYPTISQSEKWSKETLDNELVGPTPELDQIIGNGAGRRKSGNTILHKIFPGGLLNIFGSNAPGEMRRAKGNLLLADEIDAITGNAGDEGDPLEIFWVRGSEYPDTIRVAASYPSIKGKSRVEQLMLQSDWRVFKMPCSHCGEPIELSRQLLRYEHDKPEDAWLECPANGCKLTDKNRGEMIRHPDADWSATKPFSGIIGFQAGRMISPHPVQRGYASHLHWCAQQELALEVAENPERAKRVLVNTFDGLPYEAPESVRPDAGTIFDRAEDYKPDEMLPDGVLLIVWGADVQGNRIEIEFRGLGLNNEQWGLGYHVVHGSPLEPDVWRKLDALTRNAKFPHPCGIDLKPIRGFIDSLYHPDIVRKWTRERSRRGIDAIEGSTTPCKPIIEKVKVVGRPASRVWQIGTHAAKEILYQQLQLEKPTDPKKGYPNGYHHFPIGYGYDRNYFAGLTVETSELKKGKDGDWYQHFENEKGARNEPIDLWVYCKAAFEVELRSANLQKIRRDFAKKAALEAKKLENPDK